MARLLVGLFACGLYLVNLSGWFLLLVAVSLLRLLPCRVWQQYWGRWCNRLPVYWVRGNYWIQQLTVPATVWDVKGLEELHHDQWYLIICNHQSWADILILQRIFNAQIPPLKFFLKRQLLWLLPIASWACWLLDFPFVNRHKKQHLAKHPELKGVDITVTKRACEKYKNTPTTVVNFVEGTRFSDHKKNTQQSPYRYLLRPKAAGIGFSLAVLGDYFRNLLNVTIIYPACPITLWRFLCGRVKQVVIRIETVPITPDLRGDYENDRNFRIYFHRWLNQIWQKKDRLIEVTQKNYLAISRDEQIASADSDS